MINSLCLNLTDSCQFHCRYCYQGEKKPNFMSLEVAKTAIEYFYKDNLEITLFGGEPTLCWDSVIVPLVKEYPNLSYNITTNGFLLDKEKINFLAEHSIAVLLSMDGDRQTQDYNRQVGSFDKLDAMIPYLLEKFPNTKMRGTIIPATCGNTFHNIQYAQSKGFNGCYFTINIFEPWYEKNREILDKEIEKYTYYYIDSFLENKPYIELTPFTSMVSLLVKQECGILDNQVNKYKCGLGVGYCAINYKGDIYSCQEAVSIPELCIGNIYQGIDKEKQQFLIDQLINNKPEENNATDCHNCPLTFCCKKQACQMHNYLCNKNFLIQSGNQCWWNLILYKYARLTISLLQNYPKFQDYMKRIVKGER